MRRYTLAAAAGCLIALATVLASSPDGWTQYRFRTGRFDVEGETGEVRSSLQRFSATLAGLYMTGGTAEDLNAFPAERMVKRRVFMDINTMTISSMRFIPDRDRTVFRDVRFVSPVHAVAVADEDWFFAYQDLRTRRPLSTKKFNPITVRYYLKKQWGRWIVLDYDVFSRTESLPPAPVEKILLW